MIEINFEAPVTEVLGVFGKEIHLFTYGHKDDTEDFECILIMTEKEYLNQWKKWIKGKRDYCERYNHYCGVMGYVYSEDAELIGTQKLNRYNSDTGEDGIIEFPVYKAEKFWDEPDFEHG